MASGFGGVLLIKVLLVQLALVSAFSVNSDHQSSKSESSVSAMTSRRTALLSSAALLVGSQILGVADAQAATLPDGFQRIRTQFVAALGNPDASSGDEAQSWGLWRVDPGPRGVYLSDYKKVLADKSNKAPAGWTFDPKDWWLEEHGLIMEAPDFPMPAGEYLVTGGRSVTSVLKISGDGRWELEKGKLYDVTHLPCRSARYTPNDGGGSPLTANRNDFPVRPGAEMPIVAGTDKKDYAVLFVIGVKEVASGANEL